MPPLRRYSYSKFLDLQSIRLVRVVDANSGVDCAVSHSDDDDAATTHLYLEIAEFTFGEEVPYRALSYTWGPPDNELSRYTESDKITIVIDGEEHDVTPNLYEAMLQMSKSYPGGYFWVDALCINQDSTQEKQIHVAIMDKIYSGAKEVIVWLGKPDHFGKQVIDLAKKVASLPEDFFTAFGHESSPTELGLHGLPEVADPIWGSYLDFYERRWFNRGWIIQEVVLGKYVAVHCGPHTMTWDDMIAGSKIFVPERLRKALFVPLREGQNVHSLALGRNVFRIHLIQEACIKENYAYLLVVEVCTGVYGFVSPQHILVHLMRMSRDFQWSDGRDKVYSLLGLVNYTAGLHGLSRLQITPDYSPASTEATVLTAAATTIIQQSTCLGIVAQVSDPSFRRVEGLPSWVPDFRRSPNFSMGRRNLFDASKLQTPAHNFRGNTLTVRGTKIGTIKDFEEVVFDNKLETMLSMMTIALASTLPQGQDRLEVLWRTMIWDICGHAHIADFHPAPDFLGHSFATWLSEIYGAYKIRPEPVDFGEDLRLLQALRWLELLVEAPSEEELLRAAVKRALDGTAPSPPKEDTPPVESDTFTSHASGVSWSQQLFVMDSGYLGLGPKSGLVEDEVWIIAGCSFPMVLRERSDGTFFVLGRCYVHGVMHGEAISEHTEWEEVCLA